MILAGSFILLVAAVLLLLAGWRRLSVAIVLLLLLVLGLTGTSPLPQRLLSELQEPFVDLPPPDWGERNAIVVLGSGTVEIGNEANPSLTGFGRIETAVSAWRECKQAGRVCVVVVSGGDPHGKGIAEADVLADSLRELGVPEEDILRDPQSRNTFENARLTRRLLSQRNFDREFLVTSGYHMQRSLLFFRHFGLNPQPLPALMLQAGPTWLPVAGNVATADAVLHEYLGLLQYRIYNALGWNPPPVEPPH